MFTKSESYLRRREVVLRLASIYGKICLKLLGNSYRRNITIIYDYGYTPKLLFWGVFVLFINKKITINRKGRGKKC